MTWKKIGPGAYVSTHAGKVYRVFTICSGAWVCDAFENITTDYAFHTCEALSLADGKRKMEALAKAKQGVAP